MNKPCSPRLIPLIGLLALMGTAATASADTSGVTSLLTPGDSSASDQTPTAPQATPRTDSSSTTSQAAAARTDTSGADADGFKNPLQSLHYLQVKDPEAFQRATLETLNVYDPYESANRHVYHFNQRLDEKVLIPVIHGYHFLVPTLVRKGVSNFFANIADVGNLSNSLLQVKMKRSWHVTERLLLNTTIGVVGLWDPATRWGIPRESEDFGQTLGFYGVHPGPYLILPVLGPSSVRDAFGELADYGMYREINFINEARNATNYPEITASSVINTRDSVSFRYGQLNSPFEYDKLRFVIVKARQIEVDE